jgi:hypothetical protein
MWKDKKGQTLDDVYRKKLEEKAWRNLQALLKTAQANTRPKFLIELAKPTQKKNYF